MSKILVADDSRFQVALLTKALQEKGFEVVVAKMLCRPGWSPCVPRQMPLSSI
jgi:hypothetical protein